MMTKFLQELIDEIASIKPEKFEQPMAESEEGDEVILELPDDLKAFFTVMHRRRIALAERCGQAHSRMEETRKKAESGVVKDITDEDMEFARAHSMDHKDADLIKKLFWHAVEKITPAKFGPEPNLTLREGWKVVLCLPDSDDLVAKALLVGALRRGLRPQS